MPKVFVLYLFHYNLTHVRGVRPKETGWLYCVAFHHTLDPWAIHNMIPTEEHLR